ncbi:MAG: hypothetical protein JXB36_16875 [Gammaproteobacteria bacterium]|nr:hypothetical protein [Gammaproteobacteria bacterium]
MVAGEDTPLEGPVPTVKVRAPRDGQVIKTPALLLTLDVKNWALTPDGNHIHVIVDNEPYIAVRDVSKPVDLTALYEKEFGRPLAEGSHVLRIFPGRGHHESVKDGGAFQVLAVHWKQKTPGFTFDAKAPLLTYSRPKGCNEAGKRVLLDFFVSNTTLGPTASRVHYTVDGDVSGDIDAWKPNYIENLAVGEHTLALALHDASGAAAAGPFNTAERTFKVAPDCQPHAAAPSGAKPGEPPANAPLVTAPTPAGPATPKAAAPTETGVPQPAK